VVEEALRLLVTQLFAGEVDEILRIGVLQWKGRHFGASRHSVLAAC
jgi:hypothetical protein